MLVTSGDGEEKLVFEKQEGDTSGDSVLSGFGSSSGSSTDETSDQEEFIAELTRQMAENMLKEEDEKRPMAHLPKTKTTRFDPNNVLQTQERKNRHENQQQREMKEYGDGDGSRRAGFLSSALPNGSGMRVVFLGDGGLRNGSSGGTGVFIPHATNNLPDHQPRKKPGRCSTVLIPERVLQTLKQHHEKRNANQAVAHSNAAATFPAHPNQRTFQQPQETPNKTIVNTTTNINDHEELQLPQEWTY